MLTDGTLMLTDGILDNGAIANGEIKRKARKAR